MMQDMITDPDGNRMLQIDSPRDIEVGDIVYLRECSQGFTAWRRSDDRCVYVIIPFWTGIGGDHVYVDSRFFDHAARHVNIPEKNGIYVSCNGSIFSIERDVVSGEMVASYLADVPSGSSFRSVRSLFSSDGANSSGYGVFRGDEVIGLLPLRRLSFEGGRVVTRD